jgi:hypothetical protein
VGRPVNEGVNSLGRRFLPVMSNMKRLGYRLHYRNVRRTEYSCSSLSRLTSG